MKLKKKFPICSKVFNLKFIYLFIFFILGCGSSENITFNFEAELIQGGKFISEEYKGTPMVINFWYPSCPPCAKELPTLAKFQNQNLEEIKFVGIIHNSLVDKKEDSINLINKFNIKYENVYDESGDLVKDFDILGFPTTLFFDENHNLLKKWTGYLDEENLMEQLENLKK